MTDCATVIVGDIVIVTVESAGGGSHKELGIVMSEPNSPDHESPGEVVCRLLHHRFWLVAAGDWKVFDPDGPV